MRGRMTKPLLRPRPIPIIWVECPVCPNADDEPSPTTLLSPSIRVDVEEETTLNYKGTKISIKANSLSEIRILGEGKFGYVMLVEVQNHPDIKLAVKRLSLTRSRNNENDFTAPTDLRTIKEVGSGENPHVTLFYAALSSKDPWQLLICMEACKTSMEKFYAEMHQLKCTQHLDILLRRMTHHIADALLFLKSKNILHRDVKPSNILINEEPVIFKLCDFGICSPLTNSVAPTNTKGTKLYLAPERIDGQLAPKGYGIRSDMWSLGVSIIEIASGQHPFLGMSEHDIFGKAQNWEIPRAEYVSEDLYKLIVWLVKTKPADRPENYDEIINLNVLRSLPKDITSEEKTTVKIVIEKVLTNMEN